MSGFRTTSENRTFQQPDNFPKRRKPDVRFSDTYCIPFYFSVWNPNFLRVRISDRKKCLKSKLSGNGMQLNYLKSKLVRISDIHCIKKTIKNKFHKNISFWNRKYKIHVLEQYYNITELNGDVACNGSVTASTSTLKNSIVQLNANKLEASAVLAANFLSQGKVIALPTDTVNEIAF